MSNKAQHPVPMNVMNIPRSFGPNEAQSIVTYMQKRVRFESMEEADAVKVLIASFVAFMNTYFDRQAAQAQGVPQTVGLATVEPAAEAAQEAAA